MRQTLTWRFVLAVGVPLVAALTWWMVAVRAGSSENGTASRPHFVSYIASVDTLQADPTWAVKDGLTTGTARFALDDGRTLYISEATMGEITCTDRGANACVLLAEMLGDAPIWFALTPATGKDPRARLSLPPIVDMLNDGDDAVLSNGWVVPLATPTKRECDTATASLREFIDRFGEKMEVSLNLATDEIDTVRCTGE